MRGVFVTRRVLGRRARQPGAFTAGCGRINRADARVASADRPMQVQITGPIDVRDNAAA